MHIQLHDIGDWCNAQRKKKCPFQIRHVLADIMLTFSWKIQLKGRLRISAARAQRIPRLAPETVVQSTSRAYVNEGRVSRNVMSVIKSLTANQKQGF